MTDSERNRDYWLSTRNYWQGKYAELPDSLGPADDRQVNTTAMKMKGLRYGGQDGQGDYWVSKDGHVLHFADLPKNTDNGDNSDAGDSDAGGQPSFGQQQTGYGIPSLDNYQPGINNYIPKPALGGKAGILDQGAITGNNRGADNFGFPAASMSDTDGEGLGIGSFDDIPQTAGIGKFSKQSIKKTALNLPCVQQAIAAGSRVVLLKEYSVGSRAITESDVLKNGNVMLAGTVTVGFFGSLNADGSQAPGVKAGFESSCGDKMGAPKPKTGKNAAGAPCNCDDQQGSGGSGGGGGGGGSDGGTGGASGSAGPPGGGSNGAPNAGGNNATATSAPGSPGGNSSAGNGSVTDKSDTTNKQTTMARISPSPMKPFPTNIQPLPGKLQPLPLQPIPSKPVPKPTSYRWINPYNMVPIQPSSVGTYGVTPTPNVRKPISQGDVDYNGHVVTSQELKNKLAQFAKYINKTITITGGDRDTNSNNTVHGARGSRHLYGDAADIKAKDITNEELSKLAVKSGLFRTVIYYPTYDLKGAKRPHVHVDLNPRHKNLYLLYKPEYIKKELHDKFIPIH